MGKITWLRALLLAALTVPLSASAADFGMLGIVTGQTARLSVVNRATGQLPPNPCRVELSFLDTTGQPVQGDGGPVVSTATLAPGATASLDFRAVANFGTRIMIRPVVRALTPAKGAAVSTAELVDNSESDRPVVCFAQRAFCPVPRCYRHQLWPARTGDWPNRTAHRGECVYCATASQPMPGGIAFRRPRRSDAAR